MINLTQVLKTVETSDPHAAYELLPLVYDELHQLARRRMAHEKPGQTLQPTALIHEVYLRLASTDEDTDDADDKHWENRGHFFASAAETMRRILVDNARRKKRPKHGGEWRRVELEPEELAAQRVSDDLVALDEALNQLALEDPAAAQIVNLHFFAGLSFVQTAEVLSISRATVYRQWSYARAWLRCVLSSESVITEDSLETDP